MTCPLHLTGPPWHAKDDVTKHSGLMVVARQYGPRRNVSDAKPEVTMAFMFDLFDSGNAGNVQYSGRSNLCDAKANATTTFV